MHELLPKGRNWISSPTSGEQFRALNALGVALRDPEVVVCEQTMRTTFDGKEVSLPGIRVMRVRDGLIVSSKDYGNRQDG